MPELGALEPGQAASLAGLAPVARQSGRWTGRAFIRGGRANVRQAIYMPALVATRFNPDMKAKYKQLINAGKPAKVALTAVMRKLILLANVLLKANRSWVQNPLDQNGYSKVNECGKAAAACSRKRRRVEWSFFVGRVMAPSGGGFGPPHPQDGCLFFGLDSSSHKQLEDTVPVVRRGRPVLSIFKRGCELYTGMFPSIREDTLLPILWR
jgi:hypothetical protein